MTDLQRAIKWLEHMKRSYETELDMGYPASPKTAALCRILLDALRKEPCDLCIDCHNCANNGRLFCYRDCDDTEGAKRSGLIAYKHFKAKYKHCPNCGRLVG